MEVVSIGTAVRQAFALEVGDKRYTLEFPLSSVIAAEAKIGRSLKLPADWFSAASKDIPALIAAGLAKHHSEVTEAEVHELCENLDPESCNAVRDALGAMAFPRFTARLNEQMKRLEEGKSPKAESADAP